MSEFNINISDVFRLRVRKNKCLSPNDLNNLEFIQETMDNGIVTDTSTYQFLLTDNQLKQLVEGLSE